MFGKHIWLVLAAILGVWMFWGYRNAAPGEFQSDMAFMIDMAYLFFIGPLAAVGWIAAGLMAFALFRLRTPQPVPVPVRKDR